MLGCFFCTKCDCYRDVDEVVYYNSTNADSSLKNTGLNKSEGSDGDEGNVKAIERASAKRLAGPKMEI